MKENKYKEAFLFYESFYEDIVQVFSESDRGRVIWGIIEYSFGGDLTYLSSEELVILELAFKSIDVQKRRFASCRRIDRAKDVVKKYQLDCEKKSSQYLRYEDTIRALRKLALDVRKKDLAEEEVSELLNGILTKGGVFRAAQADRKAKEDQERQRMIQNQGMFFHAHAGGR